MRLFVGIPAKDIIKKRIKEWRGDFGDIGRIRWIRDENLHITLVPPWYMDNPDEVIKILSGKVAIKIRFEIKFRDIEFGPGREKRLIWVRGEESEDLDKLTIDLHNALGKSVEKRVFIPHLTIARFRREDFKSFKKKKLREAVEWEMRVDRFVLYESILSSKGAVYRVIKEFSVV